MPARRLSDDLDDLLAVPEQPEPRRRIDWDGVKNEGWLQTPPAPADQPVDFDQHLRELGFDPDHYAIDQSAGGVRVSVWEAQTKQGIQTLRSVRARVVARGAAAGLGLDADELLATIRKAKPPKRQPPAGPGAFIVAVADTQAGKSDSPDGSGAAYMVNAFIDAIGAVEQRVRELRKAGRPLGSLIIACLGDLVEGCDGHYAAQTFNVDLDRREQVRVMRRLLLKAVERWAPLFEDVTLAAVTGNHGENRRNGKAYTNVGLDSDDLAIPEQVLEIIAANSDAYGHVRGAIGGDPFTRVIEAGGHVIGMLHGHMARESGSAQQKIARWFERQAAAKAPISAADVIISGHYHHLTLSEANGAVTFIQAPALDGGSDWYRAEKAAQHNPGLLTFALYPDNPRVTDIAIL